MFEILALLLSNRGRIFSREEILHQVWSDEVIVLDRTTRKPAPTPELTLPDETNKGRFKPNKQKPRKRNMIR